ncbi:MAG: TetR/AcrR family transcriptional regulator [Methylotenera sp.]|nr:TetR/AcrR family transcriptional regulator [Oligoflexia bacterium]
MKSKAPAPAKADKRDKTDKGKKFETVAEAVMLILNQSGISAVNHTQVARLAKISRAWLYKYVGARPEDLIEFALDHFGKLFMGRGGPIAGAKPDELRQQFVENTWPILSFLEQKPAVLGLYFRYLGTANAVGRKIHELESRQLDLLAKALSGGFKLTAKEARAVAEVMISFRLGLSFRYSQTKMSTRYSQEEVDHALHRVVKHATLVTTLALEKKKGRAAPVVRPGPKTAR